MITSKSCPPAEGLIATAIYFLRQSERKLGEEVFQYFELPNHQGYQLQSQLVLQWPLPHSQRLVLEMEPNWHYRSARIELEAEKHLTLARCQVNGSQLQARIEAAGQRTVETAIPWGTSGLDYPSVLFAFALCKRLNISPGDSSDLGLVRLQLPSLEPEHLQCKCARLFDTSVAFGIGTFKTREFLLTSSSGELLHIWIDEAGVPLQIQRTEQGERIQFDLVRYRLFRR